jgi:hypothetical protein
MILSANEQKFLSSPDVIWNECIFDWEKKINIFFFIVTA